MCCGVLIVRGLGGVVGAFAFDSGFDLTGVNAHFFKAAIDDRRGLIFKRLSKLLHLFYESNYFVKFVGVFNSLRVSVLWCVDCEGVRRRRRGFRLR